MGEIFGAPRVPAEFVTRARLVEALAADAPLVVVRGAGGAGKTVAVAQWATGSATPGIWLTVDAASNTRFSFWQRVLQAMADGSLLPPAGLLLDVAASIDAVDDLRRVLVRGFSQLTTDLRLIVDDAHLISDQDVYDDLIELARGTTRLRLTVLTRVLGALESDTVTIGLAPAIVTGDDLAFTADETRAVLARHGVDDPAGDQARLIRDAVGGGPLHTRAALLELDRWRTEAAGSAVVVDRRPLERLMAAAGRRMLLAMFPSGPQSPGDLEFGLRSSIPDALTVALTRALTGRVDAEAALDAAEASGLGMWTPGPDGAQFSYSPIIRAALRAELRARMPGEERALNRTAAVWAFENGRSFAALSHAIAGGDLELASSFAMRDWFSLLRVHGAAVRETIGALPVRVLRRHPLLAMMLALAYNAVQEHRLRAVELFLVAIVAARFRRTSAPPTERAVLLTVESAAYRVLGRTDRALSAAKQAGAALKALSDDQLEDLGKNLPTMLAQTGLSYFYAGERHQALELFQAGYAHPRDLSVGGWFHSLALTAGALAVEGELTQARAVIERGRREHWPVGWADGYIGAFFQLAQALDKLEDGDPDGALSHITTMDRHLATIEHWPLFAYVSSMVALAQGRARAQAAVLDAALARGARPSVTEFTRSRLDATRALLLLASGRLSDAETALHHHPATVPGIAIAWARLHLLADAPEKARAALEPIDAAAASARIRTETMALRAAAALRMGRANSASDELDRLVALLIATGLRTPLTLLPRSDRIALAELAEQTARPASVRRLLTEAVQAPALWPEVVPSVALTERETVVLRRLNTGGSTAEIAADLFVSVNTVKTQLRSLYRKLGAATRDEALAAAREQRLLD